MALFKQSYQDNLRQLRRELSKNAQDENNDIFDPFKQFVFNISHEFVELIYADLYKKYQKKYSMPYETNIKPHVNTFKQLIELMPSFFTDTNPTINDDFLTGFYLLKCHLPTLKTLNTVSSFHAGMTSDGMLRGFYYSKFKDCDWTMLGCDKKLTDKYKKLYVNGIKNPCDIFDINSMSSINVQLSEKIRPKSLNLYTADICPYTAIDVIRMYLVAIEYVDNKGDIILRIPTNWKPFYTPMITILLMFTYLHSSVKLFKAPWSDTRKYYVILSGIKHNITNKLINNLHSYINCGDDSTPLLSNTFVNDNELIVNLIKKRYDDMSETETLDETNNIENWVKLIKDINV